MYNMLSIGGLFILMLIAWAFSTSHRTVNWRLVAWGLVFQLLFGLFVFKLPEGRKFFLLINDAVVKLIQSSSAGSKFVFGWLAGPHCYINADKQECTGFILAFQALPTIIFFSALMSALYFFRIIPILIRCFAYVFTTLMRVSGAESLCAASQIFAGVESVTTIRPYLKDMTKSELCTILTTGMATVSSNVLALYVFSLKPVFPGIAGHLVSASILSAPAALVMSKLLLPETGTPRTLGKHVDLHYKRDANLFEAIINGANAGVKLIVGIAALLIAILGLVALLNMFLLSAGTHIPHVSVFGIKIDWSLQSMLAVVSLPFSMILGVPLDDVPTVARLLGERLILTEVPAYHDLAAAVDNGSIVHARSVVIASYALCGFAHVASLAIFVGGFAAIEPSRMPDLTKVGFRALAAATLACLMTGCIAGTFFTGANTVLTIGPHTVEAQSATESGPVLDNSHTGL